MDRYSTFLIFSNKKCTLVKKVFNKSQRPSLQNKTTMSFFSPNSEKIIKQSRASTAEKLAINALLAITTTSTTRRTTTSTTTTKSTKRKRGGQRKQKTKKKTDVSTKNKKGSLTKPATLPLPSAVAPGSPSTHPRSVMTGEEKVSSAFNNGMFSIFF